METTGTRPGTRPASPPPPYAPQQPPQTPLPGGGGFVFGAGGAAGDQVQQTAQQQAGGFGLGGFGGANAFGGNPLASPAPGTPSRRASRRRRQQRSTAVATPPPIEVKEAPADRSHTVLTMVIDRSGSMASMGPEVHGGMNAYLAQQRKTDAEDEGRTTVLVKTFDNFVEDLHGGVPLEDVPEVTAADVAPRGGTALYDAIGAALVDTAALVNGLDHSPAVCVFILTDGMENGSRLWTHAAVTKQIERLQGRGWDFFFAAANQDALQTGSSLGVDRDACLTMAAAGPECRSSMTSVQACATRSKRCQGKAFSPYERFMSSPVRSADQRSGGGAGSAPKPRS